MVKIKGFNLLEERIPIGSSNLVYSWLELDPVQIRISKPRQSKLGDFRHAYRGKVAKISINSDLHPVEFLITLAHEFAHAQNFRLHGRKVKPHGEEWKSAFRNKLLEVIRADFLELKYVKAIENCYFKRESIAGSSCRELKGIIEGENRGIKVLRLEDIPAGSIFRTTSGRKLKKGEKIKIRYKCLDVINNRYYTVHPMTEIAEFETPLL